jgi:nucleoside-diphosphate-sugar epimerase
LQGDIRSDNLDLSAADRNWLAINCKAVVHSAASLAFRPSPNGEPWATNLDGTRRVLEVCKQLGIEEFHYVSTAFVCGEIAGGPVLEDVEPHTIRFHNPYEESKNHTEKLVRSTPGIVPTIYRPAVIVGDSQTGYTSTYHGIYRFIELGNRLAEPPTPVPPGVRRHVPLLLPLTGEEGRNLVPVDWVSQAIVRIVHLPAWHGRTFHLTTPNPTPVRVVKEVAESVMMVDGVELAGPSMMANPNSIERLFLDNLEEYWPYMNGDPEFDSRNLTAALPDLPAIPVNRALMARLVEFADADHWGRARRGRVVSSSAQARIDCRKYVEEIIPEAARKSRPPVAEGLDAVVALDICGAGGGKWTCGWVNGDLAYVRPGLDETVDVRYRTDPVTFDDVLQRRQTPEDAYQAGRIEVEGDVEKALRVGVLFSQFLHQGRD